MEGSVLEHVIGGGQDRSRHGADGFLRAASGLQAEELGLVVAGVRPMAAQADWTSMVLSQGAPLLSRVGLRFPALSFWPGQRPDQAIKWPAVLKRLMSAPISERIASADTLLTPGIDLS